MLGAAEVQYLVTNKEYMDEFQGAAVDAIALEDIIRAGENNHAEVPLERVTPSDAAFIMFTSGSTDVPNGIVQTHGVLLGKVQGIANHVKLCPASRIFQSASFSFEVSMGDIFCAFYAGSVLCVPSEEQRLNHLEYTMQTVRVTHAFLTPSTALQISPAVVQSLQFLMLGGEKLPASLVEVWATRVVLCNIYRTSETCIWDTIKVGVNNDTEVGKIGFSLGPILQIVDPENLRVITGSEISGELLIGGHSLAAGHLASTGAKD